VICCEKPCIRSFEPEKYFMYLCDEYGIDRMFGCFIIGYAFAALQKERWVYEQMYVPDATTFDFYIEFYGRMEKFTDVFNKYTALRFDEHPQTWTAFIEKKPTNLTADEV
jgi:hypothetical protein